MRQKQFFLVFLLFRVEDNGNFCFFAWKPVLLSKIYVSLSKHHRTDNVCLLLKKRKIAIKNDEPNEQFFFYWNPFVYDERRSKNRKTSGSEEKLSLLAFVLFAVLTEVSKYKLLRLTLDGKKCELTSNINKNSDSLF